MIQKILKSITAICFAASALLTEAATITDQPVNFGIVEYSAAAGTTKIPINVTINCTAGQAFTIKPNSSSSGNMSIYVYREGIQNGYQYSYALNQSGVIMRSSVPSSLVTGTCTGADQVFPLYIALSGSSTVGSLLAFTKAGQFSASMQLFQLTTTSTVLSAAQEVTGEIKGRCAFGSTGTLNFGQMPQKSTAMTYVSTTQISFTCDNTLTSLFRPHDDISKFTLAGGSGIDVSFPERPANPAQLTLEIKSSGAGTFGTWDMNTYKKTTVGTGSSQSFDIRGTLSLSPNWVGVIKKDLNVNLIH